MADHRQQVRGVRPDRTYVRLAPRCAGRHGDLGRHSSCYLPCSASCSTRHRLPRGPARLAGHLGGRRRRGAPWPRSPGGRARSPSPSPRRCDRPVRPVRPVRTAPAAARPPSRPSSGGWPRPPSRPGGRAGPAHAAVDRPAAGAPTARVGDGRDRPGRRPSAERPRRWCARRHPLVAGRSTTGPRRPAGTPCRGGCSAALVARQPRGRRPRPRPTRPGRSCTTPTQEDR